MTTKESHHMIYISVQIKTDLAYASFKNVKIRNVYEFQGLIQESLEF